jgi:hypothetical protein
MAEYFNIYSANGSCPENRTWNNFKNNIPI